VSAEGAPRVVVGMEVHLQLKTATKCFCGCPVAFGEQPNTTVCPVCLGLPGALPALNREALRLAVRTGLALSCAVSPRTKWDRKNYFYPDLPKGYQISQYDVPVCHGGFLPIDGDDGREKRVRVRRAHLEEDTGKSFHVGVGRRSRLDFNRCGTPLLEIVSEPDLASAEEAGRYLQELRDLVAYVGVSDGNMEQGNLRCEPNVNLVYPDGARTAIVEVKNVNSVKNVMDAIRFEAARQDEEHRARGATAENTPRSTRGWDDGKGETVHQRSKESADDYRYFPEPDLPPVDLDSAFVEAERSRLPELPRALRHRLVESLGLSAYDAGVLASDPALSAWFQAALAPGRDAKAVTNLVTQAVLRHVNATGVPIDRFPVPPAEVGALSDLVTRGEISATVAKDVLKTMVETGESAASVVSRRGLGQVSDESQIEVAAKQAVEDDPKASSDYAAGNDKALGRLVGLTMRRLGGKGNPVLVNRVLTRLLRG
jgi:aspartyl-tRNA(Asn)/glutamyl-tRNA(Gln) amidotransferase subunit B